MDEIEAEGLNTVTLGSPDKSIGRTFRASYVLRMPPSNGIGRRIREPQTYCNPMIQTLEWQDLMERADLIRAALAGKLGVSRARVTQVPALLRLALEIREYVLALPKESNRPFVTETALRSILRIAEPGRQVEGLKALLVVEDQRRA